MEENNKINNDFTDDKKSLYIFFLSRNYNCLLNFKKVNSITDFRLRYRLRRLQRNNYSNIGGTNINL